MILGFSGSSGCQRNRQLAVTPGPLSTDGASLVRAGGGVQVEWRLKLAPPATKGGSKGSKKGGKESPVSQPCP